jgi:ABC-type Fe3+/spermidine/putrescine transport system ATPase subunit
MFQDFALFPHKDVAGNVAFGLRQQDLPSAQVHARVTEMLALVGLQGFERRRVYDLSGGEQQRVALARSLAPGPRLLMLDEPLGSLDRALREELLGELHAILKRVGVTTLYVTHDQQEAFAVADHLVVMRRGEVQQRGAPQAIYRRPNSPWIARFLGLSNLLAGRVASLAPLSVDTPLGMIRIREAYQPDPASSGSLATSAIDRLAVGQAVTLLLRPEGARLAGECPSENEILFRGAVVEASFRGSHHRVVVRHASGIHLTLELPTEGGQLPATGQEIALTLQPWSFALLPEAQDGSETNIRD